VDGDAVSAPIGFWQSGIRGFMEIPVSGVVPVEQMAGDDETDTALLREMNVEAKNYLENFEWCKRAGPAYWGGGVGGVFSVFLFQIEPATADVDCWLWVIVGDIPSLYLVLDECGSPQRAAAMNLALMGEWVDLAKQGRTGADVPPTGAEPTPERSQDLEMRLAFIRAEVLPFLNN
jgi:hypothetical protein